MIMIYELGYGVTDRTHVYDVWFMLLHYTFVHFHSIVNMITYETFLDVPHTSYLGKGLSIKINLFSINNIFTHFRDCAYKTVKH